MRLFLPLMLAGVLVGRTLGGGVTWTDRGANAIKRMGFDGGGLVTVPISGAVSSPGLNLRGIAIDPAGGQMFWADNDADRLLRAQLDGSGSAIVTTLGSAFPADVRPDFAAQRLYFCDQQGSTVRRVGFDGSGLTTVVGAASGNQPYFLELDLPGGRLYWGGFTSGSVYRANLDGTGVETIITGNNNVRGVCLDRAAGMIYWINRDDKKVHRCALAALPVNVLTSPAVEMLYQGLDTPHGLVLDIPAGKLYWADTGSNAGLGTGDKAVSRGEMDGSTPQEVLAAGSEPWDVDIDPRCASYAEWRARYFRKDAAAATTDALANPDGDARANLLEYACGSHPLRGDSTASPVEPFIFKDPGTGLEHLAVRFLRRPGTADLFYYVQVSEDLVGWRDPRNDGPQPTVVEVKAEPAADFMELVTTRAEAPLSAAPGMAMRLLVQKGAGVRAEGRQKSGRRARGR